MTPGRWLRMPRAAKRRAIEREAEAIITSTGAGDRVRFLREEGDAVEIALRIAGREEVDLILCSPRYRRLSEQAGCPVYVIPGAILVPVDSAYAASAGREAISAEARLTSSKVVVLGIVPIHLYSSTERAEIELVRKRTAEAVKQVRMLLEEQGIDVQEVIRSGYPDEEILKAADAFSISLIMLPVGGKTPSELTKAAAILLEEPQRVKRPVYLLQPAV